MEGDCCIARYAPGGGGVGVGNNGVYNMSQVDRIMLRFRPIAPKPASGGSSPESKDTNVRSGRRGKRRYVRKNNNNNNNRKSNGSNRPTKRGRKFASSSSSSPTSSTDKGSQGMAITEPVVTLSLLPDAPVEIPRSRPVSYSTDLFFSGGKPQHNVPVWLNFNTNNVTGTEVVNQPVVSVPSPNPNPNGKNNLWLPKVVVVSLMVECVAETWLDQNGLGFSDEEKRRNLEGDTCPGLISDGLKRVTWMNQAFRTMVARQGGHVGGIENLIVRLVMKEGVPLSGAGMGCPAFTCRVKMQYTCGTESGNEKSLQTQILPCDVWRMDGGDGRGVSGPFAWRLDVKAALSLGLGL